MPTPPPVPEVGVDRLNHNLETSERHSPNVVTSHGWQDRVDTIRAAKAAGMEACCGGIVGMGEETDDRVDLAFSLRDLDVESISLISSIRERVRPWVTVSVCRPRNAYAPRARCAS